MLLPSLLYKGQGQACPVEGHIGEQLTEVQRTLFPDLYQTLLQYYLTVQVRNGRLAMLANLGKENAHRICMLPFPAAIL